MYRLYQRIYVQDSYFEWTKYIMTLMMVDDADKYENTRHWAQWESQAAG